MKNLGPKAARAARIILAVAIVAWLLLAAGIEDFVLQLRSVALLPLLAALVAMGAENLLRAANWRMLLSSVLKSAPVRYGHLLSCYLTTALLGTFVPSSAGTDVLRAALTHRIYGGHFSRHAASVVMLNAVSWFTGCLLALLALASLAYTARVPTALQPVAAVMAMVAVGGPAIYLLLWLRRDVPMLALRRLGPRWYRFRHAVRRFLDAILVYAGSGSELMRTLSVAGAALLMQAIGFALIAQGLGVTAPVPIWLLLVPVSAIASLLPASISGFGAAQAANALVLQAVGIPFAAAVAVTTLIPLAGTIVRAVMGGVALLLWPDQLSVQGIAARSKPQ